MKTNRIAASLVFLGAWLVAGPAQAETRPRPTEADKGYSYTFGDDPLTAPGVDAGGAILRVRPRGLRTTLTRPRLHFVPELLRSVEGL